MFGLTKKPTQNQELEKDNNLSLNQQKNFTLEDMPIYTMREDLENPGAQHEMMPPKKTAQQSNQSVLSQKQKSSPFLSGDEATWNKRRLLEEGTVEKPDSTKEINQGKIIQNEKKELLFAQIGEKPMPIAPSNQNSVSPLPKNSNIKKYDLRLVLFYFISFLLLIALIWTGYSYLKNKTNQQAEPLATDPVMQTHQTEPPKETEPAKPTLSYSQTNPNYLRVEDNGLILEKLKTTIEQISRENYTAPIEFIITDVQNKPIDFKTFSSLAGLKLSTSLLDLLGDNFSLFIYTETAGPRIGLIIESKNSTSLEKILLQEERMLADELNPLFLEDTYDKTKLFESTDYSGAKIHYQNIISPDILSVDYAVYQNKLLFGTTRATMRAIIDRLNSLKAEDSQEKNPPSIPMPPTPKKPTDK